MSPKFVIGGVVTGALVFGAIIGLGTSGSIVRVGDLPDGGVSDGGSMTETCPDNTVKCGAHCIPVEVPCGE